MNRTYYHGGSLALRAPYGRIAPFRVIRGFWVVGIMALAAVLSHAQEGLRTSMAGEKASEARRLRPDSMPFTYKAGEFRMLVTPSVGLDFNDNIDAVESNPESDFILRPLLSFDVNYPITQRNLLNLNVGFGYDYYFDHDDLSTWRLQSGSGLSFDMSAGDFLINLHDRFSYSQDSAQNSAVSGTSEFGNINNTAGILVTWDLQDVTPSLGYDHANVISPSSDFESQDRSTENVVGRVGFKIHPKVTAGVEATAAFTTYDQQVLNDNQSYSAGAYGDWQPGSALHVQPRVGYTIFHFDQTSEQTFGISTAEAIETSDVNSWYFDLTVRHDITEIISYSASAGHEIRLGVESDANEVWYVRPDITWRVFKVTTLNTGFFYEHGKQGVGNESGNLKENYDWYGGSIGLGRPITDRLHLSLNYRLTFRSSDTASREYTQNLVGLQLTYRLP